MEELPGLDIRYTQMEDEASLVRWIHLPEVQRWLPVSTESEIENGVRCWIGFSRYGASLTAVVDGVPCGIGTLFLMPYRKLAHSCLFKVVVDPLYQRQGVGTALLKNLKNLAKSYFGLEMMVIEVFGGNPLISLLKKSGFEEYARQELFVKEGDQYRSRIVYGSML